MVYRKYRLRKQWSRKYTIRKAVEEVERKAREKAYIMAAEV